MIKLLQASRTTHAHSFYVVRSEEGLRRALDFEGFHHEHLLMQEWLRHHEQLYKLYCVGGKHFDFCIKTSIPQRLVEESEGGAFFFQTRMKFLPESFTQFSADECRLSEEVLQIVARDIGVQYFHLHLFGVDILVQEETGCVYLIDINYFSSYDGLKRLNVQESFRDLIRETIRSQSSQ